MNRIVVFLAILCICCCMLPIGIIIFFAATIWNFKIRSNFVALVDFIKALYLILFGDKNKFPVDLGKEDDEYAAWVFSRWAAKGNSTDK